MKPRGLLRKHQLRLITAADREWLKKHVAELKEKLSPKQKEMKL